MTCTIWMRATPKFIAESPSVIPGFVKAVMRMIKWLQTPAPTQGRNAALGYHGARLNLYEDAASLAREMFTADGRVPREGTSDTSAVLSIYGLPAPNRYPTFNNQFAQPQQPRKRRSFLQRWSAKVDALRLSTTKG